MPACPLARPDTPIRLWTIAHRAIIDQALATGRGYASWAHVQQNWRPSYRWMLERMRDRGLLGEDPVDAPPIWAWHSCEAWQKPPTNETVDMLLGFGPENRQDLWMVTWRASPRRVLVSSYERWCDVMDAFIEGTDPAPVTRGVLFPQGIRKLPRKVKKKLRDWHLQACAPALLREDIVSMQPLETWK